MSHFKLIPIFIIAATAVACVDLEQDELLGEQEAAVCTGSCLPPPPPPPGDPVPPVISANAEGEYGLPNLRLITEAVTADIIAEVNANPNVPGTLSWRGQGPWLCGYACNTSPKLPRAGAPYVESTTYVRLKHKAYVAFVREITVPMRIRASCANWQYTGVGELIIAVQPQKAIVEGGSWTSSWGEWILNFLTAGHLSAEIDARINNGLGGSTGGTTKLRLGECTSLGRRSGYPSNSSLDAIRWDIPE